MIWILSQKKLSLVNNTMNGSAAQAQGTHNNHDTNFVPNYYHTPRRAKNSPVLPIGRAHNGLIPYPWSAEGVKYPRWRIFPWTYILTSKKAISQILQRVKRKASTADPSWQAWPSQSCTALADLLAIQNCCLILLLEWGQRCLI